MPTPRAIRSIRCISGCGSVKVTSLPMPDPVGAEDQGEGCRVRRVCVDFELDKVRAVKLGMGWRRRGWVGKGEKRRGKEKEEGTEGGIRREIRVLDLGGSRIRGLRVLPLQVASRRERRARAVLVRAFGVHEGVCAGGVLAVARGAFRGAGARLWGFYLSWNRAGFYICCVRFRLGLRKLARDDVRKPVAQSARRGIDCGVRAVDL